MGLELKFSTAINVGSTFSFEIKAEYDQDLDISERRNYTLFLRQKIDT